MKTSMFAISDNPIRFRSDEDECNTMKVTEVVTAWGHENILATNHSTFEITKDTHLTKRGNCIIGVAANKSFNDLSDQFKTIIKKYGTKITITLEADGERALIEAEGHPKLTLRDSNDMVVRKSIYICRRTLAIKSNKAADDLPRNLIKKLKNPNKRIFIRLTAESTQTG